MDQQALYYLLCAAGGYLLARMGVGASFDLGLGKKSPAAEKKVPVVKDSPENPAPVRIVYVQGPPPEAADPKVALQSALASVKANLDAEAKAKFDTIVAQSQPK